MNPPIITFIAVFIFFEYDEYDSYKRNIQIEKAPSFTTAQFNDISKYKSQKYHNASYILKYKFQSPKGEFFGSTGSLDDQQLKRYLSLGSIDIVYYADNPKFNTLKTYFRQGQTEKEFSQSFVVSGFIGLIAALIIGLLSSIIAWSKQKFKLSTGGKPV